MSWNHLNWKALENLRETFLSERPGVGNDYWKDEEELNAYDLTFAQRIGWKWDAVLREVKSRQWSTLEKKPWLLDWGCGSGIATKKFLTHFPKESISGVYVWDRSPLARRFAKTNIAKEFSVDIQEWKPDVTPLSGAIVLLSHVLGELDEAYGGEVLRLISQAGAVFWVEPGTPFLSRKLIAVREQLSQDFSIIAPCPHQGKCGMLTPDNDSHWCHNFAEPPAAVFQSAQWAMFSKKLGIDLRSLPVSFLVMQRKTNLATLKTAVDNRVIGRPRIYKGMAKVLVCQETGVLEKVLRERNDPALYKAMKRNSFTTLLPNDSLSQEEE